MSSLSEENHKCVREPKVTNEPGVTLAGRSETPGRERKLRLQLSRSSCGACQSPLEVSVVQTI